MYVRKFAFNLYMAIIAIGIVTFIVTVNNKPNPVEYFKAGQVMLPDYVCSDTLVVIDADGLNRSMALVEQGIIDATDYQIDSILHNHCKIK